MKKILILTLLITIYLSAAAQKDTIPVHDPQAKKILDKVSQRYKDFSTLRLYFEYQIYDNRDSLHKLQDKFKGWLFVKGQDKYKLIIPDVEVFCDGIKIYSLDKKNKELTITLYDPEAQSVLSPQKLLYIYQKGFKYLLRGTATFDTKTLKNGKIAPLQRTMYIVDLYPEHPKKSPYSIIRLWIDKNTYQIVSVKYQGKDGIDYVVDILEEKSGITIPDIMFKYDPKRLPKGTEINDMTEN